MTDDDRDLDPGTLDAPSAADRLVLARVDQRGRAAARSLATALPGTPRADGRLPSEDRPAEVALVVDRDRPARIRRSRRRVLVGAAAAVAVVVAGIAFGLASGDAPTTVAGAQTDYLVAGWLPEGMAATSATTLGGLSADAPEPVGGEVVAYGDGAAADPWAGPTISVIAEDVAPEGDHADEDQGGETISVNGHDAVVEQDAGGVRITWEDDGRRIVVRGSAELDRPTVVAAAGGADSSPSIAPDALPPGFVEIGRGPLDAMMGAGGPGYVGRRDGLVLGYSAGTPSVPDATPSVPDAVVSVFQREGPESAVDLVRLTSAPTSAAEVRGRHAVVGDSGAGPESPEPFVQWREPSGLVTTVAGSGVDEATVLRIAEGLRPAETGEIDRLRDADGLSSEEVSGSAGAGDSGIVLAEGQHEGQQWRLVLGDAGELRELALWFRGSSGGTGWREDEPTPPLVSGMSSGGTWTTTVVYGLVADGLTVVVDIPGMGIITPELAPATEGVDGRGFVVFLSEPPPAGTEFAVRARNPASIEVASDLYIYAPAPNAPG